MAIASLNILFRTDISQFNKQFRKAERSVERLGRKMEAAGKTMTRSLTLPIIAVGAASVKMATDVETSFTKIETLVGLSADAVEGLKNEVEGISRKTAKGTQELADALFVVTSAGLRGADAVQVLDKAAQASAIGLGETKDIARATTAVLQAYGTENISAARATEILLGTVRAGNLEASELAPVLGRVIGIASQFGVSFEEVGASVATFTRLGVSSEEAITGLRGIMNTLLKESPQAAKALDSVGLSFDGLRRSVREKGLATTLIDLMDKFRGNEAALAEVIPNVRALSAVLGTAGAQGEAYAQILKDLQADTDNLGSGMERVSETSAFKFQEALNNLRLVGEDIGAKLLPVVVKLAEKVAVLAEKWSNLSEQQIMAKIKLAALFAVMGPVLTVLGRMVTIIPNIAKAWRTLNAVMNSNPFILVASAIAAVTLALGRMMRKAKMASEAQKELNEEAKAGIKIAQLSEEQWVNMATGMNISRVSIERLNQRLKDYSDRLKEVTKAQDESGGSNFYDEEIKDLQRIISALQMELSLRQSISTQKAGGTVETVELLDLPVVGDIDTNFLDTSETQQEWVDFADLVRDESRSMADQLSINMERANEAIANSGNRYAETVTKMNQQTPMIAAMTAAFMEMGNQIGDSFLAAEDGVQSFAKKMKSAAKKIISAFISQGVSAVIANTLSQMSGLLGPLAIPIAAAAGAAASALFNAAVPALAGGGLAYGATMAMVGDNPRASVDPEVIAPLSKLQGMMGVAVVGETRLRGKDIYISWREEQRFRDRN